MKKAQCGIILFNAAVLVLCFLSIDVPSRILRLLLMILLAFCVIGLITLWHSGRLADSFQNFHLLLFGAIVFFCILETMKFYPKLIPLQIRNYLEEKDIQEIRNNTVEYLDQSPFGKFKANATVVSQFYRGTNKQFVYEWKTDKLGFKNPKEMLENGNIEIVALGDSFTEGMGVAVEDTWPSILTNMGHITYNLGVQGYAPTQLESSFRLYGYALKPQYVIIGYCAETYNRESIFFDEKAVIKGHRLAGGIASIASYGKEVRIRSKYVTIALFLWLRDVYRNKSNSLFYVLEYDKYYKAARDKDLYKKYASEILKVDSAGTDASKVEASLEYKKALNAFLNIKKIAGEIKTRVIFIYLPHRGYMYYEKVTGKKLPERCLFLIESKLLKKFCEKEGIIFLDPSRRILDYVKNMDGKKPSLYPYLEIDGHMSKHGNHLIAEEILAYLNAVKN